VELAAGDLRHGRLDGVVRHAGRAVYRAGHIRPDTLVVDELADSNRNDRVVEPDRDLRDGLDVTDDKPDRR
jgi:hypothetical protein